jgi:hypothetical protein
MQSFRALLVLVCAIASGCTGPAVPADGGESCTTDLDCDDGHECTIDSCGVSNLCRHDEVDELCADGLVCESGRGCVSSASCASDTECDDSIACTTDSCGVGGICNHTPVNARCGAGETCDTAMGCVAPTGACAADADCNDDVACTRDTCAADRTCSNTALDELCDTAAGERCSATAGCFVPMPCTTEADCQDGNFCNGRERCTAEFGCAPAEAPVMCNDSNDCTLEMCDPTLTNDDDPTQMGACSTPLCDSSRAECDCPTTGPSCTGTFTITPPQSDTCVCFGGPCQVDYDLSSVTFEIIAGSLRAVPARAHFTAMTDSTAPVCPSFTAVATVTGGTTETFTLQGTFTDEDTFTGTFIPNYGGLGGVVGCREGSFPITGTRVP